MYMIVFVDMREMLATKENQKNPDKKGGKLH